MNGWFQRLVLLVFAAALLTPARAAAQSWSIDGHVGRASFKDGNEYSQLAAGLAARGHFRRVGLGLGVTHRSGSRHEGALFAYGLISLDLRSSAAGQRVVPYLSLLWGAVRQGSSGGGGALELVAGARVALGDHLFIAPEASVGAYGYPYTRVGVSIGVRR